MNRASFSCALAVLCVVTLVGTAVRAQTAFVHMSGGGQDVRMTQVAPDIYQFTVLRDSYARQINSIAVVTSSDVIMFDTMTRPSSAALVVRKLKQVVNKPVRYVINSHAHPDHWLGTQTYTEEYPALDVIASEQVEGFMHLMAAVWPKRIAGQFADKQKAVAIAEKTNSLADGSPTTVEHLALDRRDLIDLGTLSEEIAHLTPVFPTIVYKDRLQFIHGGRRLELTAMSGDQDGTTVVYLPDQRVLLTGDLVAFPMPFINSRPSRQLESLKAIDSINFAVLIPGHGPAFRNHDYLRLEIALIDGAIAGVKRELAAGDAELATVQSHVTLDGLRTRFTGGDADLEQRYTSRVRDLVKFAFQEITGSGS